MFYSVSVIKTVVGVRNTPGSKWWFSNLNLISDDKANEVAAAPYANGLAVWLTERLRQRQREMARFTENIGDVMKTRPLPPEEK